jgi:penicillin-binding protein 2
MKQKSFVIGFFIILVGLIIGIRLFYIQIIDKEYKKLSYKNAIKKEYIIPERGYIYDRNGKLLVSNLQVYDIMGVPNQIKNLDTTKFIKYTGITLEELKNNLKKAKQYSWNKASLIVPRLYKDEIALFAEKINQFPGFYIQKRAIRKYHTNSAANVLGFIREVNIKEIKKDSFYIPGDLIGKAGVEKSYELQLRGKKGIKYYLTDKFNRKIESYKNGAMDIPAEAGKDLKISIDIALQEFADSLMIGKRGAIVALEPQTGEILTLVTAPGYAPEFLSGRNSSKNFNKLFKDKVNNPLLDRGLQGAYPPGSPFKLVNALVGLQEEVITPQTSYICNHGFYYGKKAHMFCHCGANGRKVKLPWAITNSCNTFFSKSYIKIIDKYSTPAEGLDKWSKHVKSFGLGQYLNTDLPVGSKGFIPDSKFYDRYYGKGKWYSTFTLSNGIGQGEVSTTPIQLANVMNIIANRGLYYTPHIIKEIDHGKSPINSRFKKPNKTTIDSIYFSPVIENMANVYKHGTAKYSRLKDIELCGKTGTSENKIKVDGKIISLPDHSIFVAFGPKDNPKISVAVFIENGGYGATIAAPIATLVIEKYLKGKISRSDLWNNVRKINLEDIYKIKYNDKQQ